MFRKRFRVCNFFTQTLEFAYVFLGLFGENYKLRPYSKIFD